MECELLFFFEHAQRAGDHKNEFHIADFPGDMTSFPPGNELATALEMKIGLYHNICSLKKSE